MKENWYEKYKLVLMYYREHGDLNISEEYEIETGIKLKSWLYSQKRAYRSRTKPVKGGLRPLTDEQVVLLEMLDIKWEPVSLDDEWDRKYKLACKYYQEHHNLLIDRYYTTEDGTNLGTWIKNQRTLYKKRLENIDCSLTDERIELLERIGMVWDLSIDHEKNWMINFLKAKKYYYKFGNLRIPMDYIDEDGTKLGLWISTQRKLYKVRNLDNEKKVLSFEKIELLESIGMIWDASIDYDKRWMECFLEVKACFEGREVTSLEDDYIMKTGVSLNNWLYYQRIAYKNRTDDKSTLTDHRIELLESIGMIWNCNECKKK